MITTTFINTINQQPDPNAQKFLLCSGITNPTITVAVDKLASRLRTNYLWPKYHGLWPTCGGTAFTNSFNLINPFLYRLTYTGGITHNANGMTFNGTTGYADTGINPFLFSQNNFGLGVYIRNNSDSNCAIGCATSPTTFLQIYPRVSNLFDMTVNSNNTDNVANTDSRGYYTAERTASNVVKGFKNGVEVVPSTRASVAPPNRNITLGARNAPSVGQFTNFNEALERISQGFVPSEVALEYAIVQAFNTDLARQV